MRYIHIVWVVTSLRYRQLIIIIIIIVIIIISYHCCTTTCHYDFFTQQKGIS